MTPWLEMESQIAAERETLVDEMSSLGLGLSAEREVGSLAVPSQVYLDEIEWPLDKGYGLKYIDNVIDTPPFYLQTMCSIIKGYYTAWIPSKLLQKLLAQQTK
ncbi:MAG: hypothetical protein FRX49_11088 [Trebouxia sp. A1-2]|nr:MAG: hypothetical protein FRX49_11088 [Trebouxia sp. A1-2]